MEKAWTEPIREYWKMLFHEDEELRDSIGEENPGLLWQAEQFRKWMKETGADMMSDQIKRAGGITPQRRDDFQKVSSHFCERLKRRRQAFMKEGDAAYLDWLFESPYLLDRRLSGFEV